MTEAPWPTSRRQLQCRPWSEMSTIFCSFIWVVVTRRGTTWGTHGDCLNLFKLSYTSSHLGVCHCHILLESQRSNLKSSWQRGSGGPQVPVKTRSRYHGGASVRTVGTEVTAHETCCHPAPAHLVLQPGRRPGAPENSAGDALGGAAVTPWEGDQGTQCGFPGGHALSEVGRSPGGGRDPDVQVSSTRHRASPTPVPAPRSAG